MKKRGRKPKIDAIPNEEVDHSKASGYDDEKPVLINAVSSKQNVEELQQKVVCSTTEDSDENEGEEEDNSKRKENEEDDSEEEEEDEDSSLRYEDKKKTIDRDEVGSDMDSETEDKRNDIFSDAIAGGSQEKQFLDSEDRKEEAAQKIEEPKIEEETEEKMKVDLNNITYKEVFQLLERESPELLPLIKDCKYQLWYLEKRLLPLKKIANGGAYKDSKSIVLLDFANQLIQHYIMSIVSCLYPKKNDEPINKSLGKEQLNSFKSLLLQLKVLLGEMDDEVELLMASKDIREEIALNEESVSVSAPKNRKEKRKNESDKLKKNEQEKLTEGKKRCLEKLQNDDSISDQKELEKDEANEQSEGENNEDHDNDKEENKEELEEQEDEKEVFTPKTRKENKHPRVKNKNKYKKAGKKRKGQVQESKKEPDKPDGESLGIKKNNLKSTKLK